MKKLILYFILLGLPMFSMAQSQLEKTDSLNTYIINELQDYWNLGIDSAGKELPNFRTGLNHARLFTKDAIIDDDINAVFRPEKVEDQNPYKTGTAKAEEWYAHDLTLQFKSLKVDTVYNIKYNSGSGDINSNKSSVEFTRKISGQKNRKYVFDDPASLLNTLKTNKNNKQSISDFNDSIVNYKISSFIAGNEDKTYSFTALSKFKVSLETINDTIKISRIERLEVLKFDCTNDRDNDGVLDDEDVCPYLKGDITAQGCPDFDMDGVADNKDECDYIYGDVKNHGCPTNYFTNKVSFAFIVGAQANSVNMNLPELDKTGYNNLDFNESQKGKIKNPDLIPSPVFGAELSYYFGKKKKTTGFSLGMLYTTFKANYQIDEPTVYTFRASDGIDDYRRRITLKAGSEEEINYRILNMPLLIKWRWMKTKTKASEYKVSFEFSAGPSFMMFQNSSKYNYNVDFEGLYQIDTITKNKIVYYDYFNNSSTYNVMVTANNINQQSSIPGSDIVFGQLNDRQYDFASNKNIKGTDKKVNRNTIGINAKFDGYYRMAKHTSFKFGAGVVYAPLFAGPSGYKAIDKTTDEFNSIYNAQAQAYYFAFALNMGFVIHW